jgi:hypothetical protein
MPHSTGHQRRETDASEHFAEGCTPPSSFAFSTSEAQTYELRRLRRPRLLAYWTRLLDPVTAMEGPVSVATTDRIDAHPRAAAQVVEGLHTRALCWTDLVLEEGQWVALANHPTFAEPARRQAREEYWLHLTLNSLLIVVLAGLYGWLSFG